MSQNKRIHDPLIDTIENSDDEKVEEIIAAACSQDQLDIVEASQESSMLGVFNGESLCSSGVSPFKKNYNAASSLVEDSDALAPFSIDLESIHNSPLPMRNKVDLDHYSVSVSDSLPSHVMELDSPEPDLYEQDLHDSTEGMLMSTKTKYNVQQSFTAEEQHIAIQTATEVPPSPGTSNGEECDDEVEFSDEVETYSQCDVFDNEPKIIDRSLHPLDSFNMSHDNQPNVMEEIKEISPISMLKELEYAASKRKRDDSQDEVKPTKKPSLEHRESQSGTDYLCCADSREIEILNDTDQSIEVLYDNKLQEKDSINSQDIRLFLSSNTQSMESQPIGSSSALSTSFQTEDNGHQSSVACKQIVDSESVHKSPDLSSFLSNNSTNGDESVIAIEQTSNIDNPDIPGNKHLPKAVINLPLFDTPSQLTDDCGEALFVNATIAARAKSSENSSIVDSLRYSEKADSSLYGSPAEMTEEKCVLSGTPVQISEETISQQSTPLQTPSQLFAPQQKLAPNRSHVLAEDSDEEKSNQLVNSSESSKENDTEIESVNGKSEDKSGLDLKRGTWVTTHDLKRWYNPETKEVVYSMNGDTDVIIGDSGSLEKILFPFTRTGSRKMSNISSNSGVTSDGYLGDKSSSASSFCTSLPDITRFDYTRQSLAPSVITISPPAAIFKLPLPKIITVDRDIQTDEASSPPKTRRIRGRPRGRPKVIKEDAMSPISERIEAGSRIDMKNLDQKIPLENSNDFSQHSILPKLLNRVSTKTSAINVDVETSAFDSDSQDDFFGHIPQSLLEKLKNVQTNLSEEDEKIFINERKKHNEISVDDQNTIIRQRIREADIAPNMLVFARYNSDKNYYSAIVKEKDREDRWKIVYNLDNQLASVREIYMLPTEFLPKSYPVYVLHPSRDFHEPGIVKGHVYKDNMVLHIVERLNGELAKVPHSHMSLKETHANVFLSHRASYRSLVSSPGGDLALDNILVRRTRGISNSPMQSHRKEDKNFDSSGQEEYGSKRKGHNRPNLTVTMEASETSDCSSSPLRKKTLLNSQKTPKSSARTPKRSKKERSTNSKQVEVQEPLNPVVRLNQLTEKEYTPKKRGRKAGSGKTPKKTRKVNEGETNQKFVEKYGRIPPENSTIFEGFSILMTEMINVEKYRLQNFDEPSPMEREHLTRQIESGGGKVLTSFDSANLAMISEQKRTSKVKNDNKLAFQATLEARESPAKVLCVSNATCRTAKYIQCLTVGIPIVSTMWVIASSNLNTCVNWMLHILPAGVSLLTESIMEQSFKDFDAEIADNLAKVVDVLKGDKVFLATSSEPTFKDTWFELLSTAGAQVFTKTESGKLNRLMDRKTSVVLADASIPADELQRAKDINAPVVSTEWFIQCIIQRCKVHYTAHPKFKYNYEEDSS